MDTLGSLFLDWRSAVDRVVAFGGWRSCWFVGLVQCQRSGFVPDQVCSCLPPEVPRGVQVLLHKQPPYAYYYYYYDDAGLQNSSPEEWTL